MSARARASRQPKPRPAPQPARNAAFASAYSRVTLPVAVRRTLRKEMCTGLGVILFGGSFDPPHKWHMHAVKAAVREMQRCEPDRAWVVVLVPAAKSPLKASGPHASDAARLAMTRLALRDAGALAHQAIVWDDEIRRAKVSNSGWDQSTPYTLPLGGDSRASTKPSYTIDTVRRLRAALKAMGFPRARVRLLIGADQAAQFHRWRAHRLLLRLAEPLLLPRPPTSTRRELERVLRESGAWSKQEINAWHERIVPMQARAMSSTGVREVVGRTRASRADSWLSPSVRAYIRAHRLYAEDTERKTAQTKRQMPTTRKKPSRTKRPLHRSGPGSAHTLRSGDRS